MAANGWLGWRVGEAFDSINHFWGDAVFDA
jgi:hypothetical protein